MEPGDTGGWANLVDRTPPPMPLIFGSGHYRPPVVPDYDFEVQFDVPAELSEWFDRYVVVFGVYVFTSSTVDDWAMQVILNVPAEWRVSYKNVYGVCELPGVRIIEQDYCVTVTAHRASAGEVPGPKRRRYSR